MWRAISAMSVRTPWREHALTVTLSSA